MSRLQDVVSVGKANVRSALRVYYVRLCVSNREKEQEKERRARSI